MIMIIITFIIIMITIITIVMINYKALNNIAISYACPLTFGTDGLGGTGASSRLRQIKLLKSAFEISNFRSG